MRIRWFTTLAILLLASSATAATLTLDLGNPGPDPGPGDFVDITLTLDLDGTELGQSVFVELQWNGAAATSRSTSSQSESITSFDGVITWIQLTGTCLNVNGRCAMLDQVGALQPIPVDPGQVVATLRINYHGLFLLQPRIVSETFNAFGLTPDDVIIVPEPASGALLALGVLGLARLGRSRTR